MITRSQYNHARDETKKYLQRAGVLVTEHDLESLEVADFGLGSLETIGAQIITLVDTGNIGVKLIVNFPGQTEPEHFHPRLGEYSGKEETIRCQWGTFYLFIPGERTPVPQGRIPDNDETVVTAFHEIVLHPGQQLTLVPGTPHWFQGGPQGSVIWSFSTKVVDGRDQFNDPNVQRETVILENP